jgi:hypothetical protein
MAGFGGLGAVEAGRTRRARLKVDPASGINILSAHHYFTRQVIGIERQETHKSLIIISHPRDSLIVPVALDQPHQSSRSSQGDGTLP